MSVMNEYQQTYRTLDDMTQQERDALCKLYGTTISKNRQPYEDAPSRIFDSSDSMMQSVRAVLDSPRASPYVRKACAKLLHGLEYRGYLSAHQKAQLRRWQQQLERQDETRVRSGTRGGAPVAGSPRAPVASSKGQPSTAARRKKVSVKKTARKAKS